MSLDLREIKSIAPEGALTVDQWCDPNAAWLREMPWEQAKAELEAVRHDNPELAETLSWLFHKLGEVEDQTIYYEKYLGAVRGIERKPIKMGFKDGLWVPQELTHGAAMHALGDMTDGSAVSTRHERDMLAQDKMTLKSRLGGVAIRVGIGNIAPEHLELGVYIKGYPNEQSAEATYKTIQNWLHSLGLRNVAEFFSQPIREEASHGRSYLAFALEILEGNSHMQKYGRWLIARDTGAVGDEIRTKAETAKMIGLLVKIDDGKFVTRAKRADELFQKNLPNMQGVKPLQSRLAA